MIQSLLAFLAQNNVEDRIVSSSDTGRALVDVFCCHWFVCSDDKFELEAGQRCTRENIANYKL